MAVGPNNETDKKNVPEPKARIYSYTKGNAEVGSFKVVTGQLPVVSKKARVLLDSGAIRSFISIVFVNCLDRHVK